MPKPSPVADDLTRPFWDACNEERLVVQNCPACTSRRGLLALQHPPRAACHRCGTAALEWHEVSGRGRVQSYAVMHDTPVASLQPDQPFNIAVIALREDAGVQFLSHLPGTPPGDVPIGASVEVLFESTPTTGQKVPEWRRVS